MTIGKANRTERASHAPSMDLDIPAALEEVVLAVLRHDVPTLNRIYRSTENEIALQILSGNVSPESRFLKQLLRTSVQATNTYALVDQVSMSLLRVLTFIWNNGGILKVGALSTHLLLSSHETHAVVDRLASEGLVTFRNGDFVEVSAFGKTAVKVRTSVHSPDRTSRVLATLGKQSDKPSLMPEVLVEHSTHSGFAKNWCIVFAPLLHLLEVQTTQRSDVEVLPFFQACLIESSDDLRKIEAAARQVEQTIMKSMGNTDAALVGSVAQGILKVNGDAGEIAQPFFKLSDQLATEEKLALYNSQ